MSNYGHQIDSFDNTICINGEDEEIGCQGKDNRDNEHDMLDESLNQELEKKLMNQVVHSEKEAYDLYCAYAHQVGFSVRRGKQYYYIGTKNLRSKLYFCSKEGMKTDIDDKEGSIDPTYHKLDTRTDCKAMITFEVDKDGQWKASKFVKEHNHEMAKEYEKHLLRSRRVVSKAKSDTLISMVNSGIAITDAYSYLSKESGGVANVGFLKKDAFNLITSARNSVIEKGDAQTLVNSFKSRVNTTGMFYWDVELDDDGRMLNFFWRDGRSRIDYDLFGDVLVFDATYRKNRYNLVCAPFVGVNHHWQTIIFGCAFLSNENAESFEWAFRTFLESMGNNPPKTILTDQDQAMMKAIDVVFPDSSHRLCLWHISQNAQSHLRTINANRNFQDLFQKCLYGCETKEELEETWDRMIKEHNLEGHTWLKRLYALREKWSAALNNDTFSAGFKSTSRSEGMNSVLTGIGSVTTSLTKFFLEFEVKLGEWRQTESDSDFACKNGKPPIQIKESPLLQHAAKYYTHKLYKVFEHEFMDILACFHEEQQLSNVSFKFLVTSHTKWGPKTRTVILDVAKLDVHCSCNKFGSMGILCTHALAAFKAKNILKIPKKYLLKRWSKDAKKRVNDDDQQKIFHMVGTGAQLVFTNCAMRYAYDVITRSQCHAETRYITWKGIQNLSMVVDDFFKKLSSTEKQSASRRYSSEDVEEIIVEKDDTAAEILNPIQIRTKGREKGRLKGHFEKKRKVSSSQGTGHRRSIQTTNGSMLNNTSSMDSTFSLSSLNLQPQMTLYRPNFSSDFQVPNEAMRHYSSIGNFTNFLDAKGGSIPNNES